MKFVLIALVILSILLLLGLLYMSFKLLRKAQKEELQQRREMRKSGNYQVHPQVAEEWKRLEKLKKDLENKEK
ncbi:hypothetical protein ACNPQK_04850 [Acinetobacter guillouiae]|uniref:Uncharacterized protein n=1 Tax=Acinetobacter guillouiae TaxID=106649 RepID=A0A6A1RUQ8_ACIGI|nr:hypothetical protein [Acinetobacter guillouiae]ENU60407.1 hypothetical protein F981_00319 [Acinetobacter guillouiae CIP 63.46]MDN5432926.1 hypothetical protein [Acinetobacter sp.]MRT35613.1 hypothetical protein [Acinetobacter sp. RIT698]QLD63358.1 hypothetical protein CQZ96_019725 [Acinetobacter sp. MYb10]KAB0630457.1 hypothetical protein F7P82_00680 [Acinetobacter guillouiae]